MVTGGIFVFFVLFMAWFFVNSAIDDLQTKKEEYAELLHLVKVKGEEYKENQKDLAQLEKKGRAKPTPLRTLIDKIGNKLEVTVPDIKELPDQKYSGWVEHAAELSLRQIGLLDLTRFMEEVEANRTKFPIAITRIEIRKRRRAQDEFDIKMVVSTYEQTAAPTGAEKTKPGAGRKGVL